MKISALTWTTFRIPFRQALASSRGALPWREGLVLRIVTDSGVAGIGEASPLPERGGTLTDVLAILGDLAETFIGRGRADIEASLDATARPGPALSAVRCAFDTALCDARARAEGIAVARLLADAPSPSVCVNATIGAPSPADAAAAAEEARAAGFRSVKLKVGLARSVRDECERVAAVRRVLGPDAALRVDANGAWNVERAVCTIRALERNDLEWVEQPVPPGCLEAMKRVREAVRTPIAADEDVTGIDAARRLLEAGAAQVLVLKPMAVGGLRPAYRIAQLAEARKSRVVVTTTVDTGIATAAALHLAAVLPPDGPACGLATGPFLSADLITRPLVAHGGRMQLPPGPGLGVELDPDQLRRHGFDFHREIS